MNISAEKEQLLLGDFVVERVLGEGGMGKVWLVRSRSTGERFAMKRAKFRDWAGQRNFLLELQTWYGLPDHPHLAACRFFRTLENEIAIFAEYVNGGSLADWIDQRKLTRLDQMLDVAIQFAWGLHAAHEQGVVHQDVKPSNMLIATPFVAPAAGEPAGLIVKVSDFGLARARVMPTETPSADPQESALVSAQVGTIAYRSPEQARGLPLSPQADIWSWGVSVLEMFAGAVFWRAGSSPANALEKFVDDGQPHAITPMPDDLVDILSKCFRDDPVERWADMAEVADTLCRIHRRELKREFTNASLTRADQTGRSPTVHDRRTGNVQWADPRRYLAYVLPDAEVASLIPPPTLSRKGQAIGDLIAYEEAIRIFGRLLAEGHEDLSHTFLNLCRHKALIHSHVGDTAGALTLIDQVIAIGEPLVCQNGRDALAHELAMAYHDKAIASDKMGEHRDAVVAYDRELAIYERLVNKEGNRERAATLAMAYAGKAIALRQLGQYRAALALLDQAIAIYEQPVNQEDRCELSKKLSFVYWNKANALAETGDLRAALPLYDQALAIYESLVNQDGRGDPSLANDLAQLCLSKSVVLRDLGEREALLLTDRAITIREHLVSREGRGELAGALGLAYMAKATTLHRLDEPRASLRLYDLAVSMYERLVNQEGKGELASELAGAYLCKGIALRESKELPQALTLYEMCITIYERLVNREGRGWLADKLADAYQNKANALGDIGKLDLAISFYDKAIVIFEDLVNQEDRGELAKDLALVYQNKANSLADLGELVATLPLYDRAIAIYERLVNQEAHNELANDLADLYEDKAASLVDLDDDKSALLLYDLAIGIRERSNPNSAN